MREYYKVPSLIDSRADYLLPLTPLAIPPGLGREIAALTFLAGVRAEPLDCSQRPAAPSDPWRPTRRVEGESRACTS
jgi:hypothetical protein